MPAKKVRSKHVPHRTCVGCREILPKRALIRIVRNSEGVQVDTTGKKGGRGAYLHDKRSCWDIGLKGSLARALRINLDEKDIERLKDYSLGLSDAEEN